MTHVLVVGSGIAGLATALELRRLTNVQVTVLAKGTLQDSNTWYAQGGIAAVLPGAGAAIPRSGESCSGDISSGDSTALHLADTLAAGAGACDERAVHALVAGAGDSIRRLVEVGTEFDRTSDGSLALGTEAAHSAARILHIGGDATGAGIARSLIRAARADTGITLLENAFLADLVTEAGEVTGGVVMVGGDSRHEGKKLQLAADAVVLATGGAGGMFQASTNPSMATADGVAAAWRAGAVLADLEFFQFHPTSLDVPGHPLISEAVRGEGAVLRDAAGRRFLKDYHPAGELAPRDVVSRSIAFHLAATDGRQVYLDATGLGADFLSARFPGLTETTRRAGFDWSREVIPVVPAAHYWMGGVATDTEGRTSLPRLYAVGEVARTGVHGANRLASNSLLEGLVFGIRAAGAIVSGSCRRFSPEAHALQTSSGPEPATRADVRRVMSEHVSVLRDEAGLRVASKQLAQWHVDGSTREHRETANLLLCAALLVRAAALRQESRGAHFRTDFPRTDAAYAGPIMLRSTP
ncbi:L-aspartate oxidase [Arthrobacter sp. JZ12]|uniref:L-aspartate oxidase n=1 Tax=Arthrobacter sp. JZ12 TaxID=2654190 RepID=UPI002B498602|nr:L-aspartate oxidase [Arthrobacter sp. JZ12]WRH25210.1 L-aspartate oxidase [Arthrobacter sp. JZ12]